MAEKRLERRTLIKLAAGALVLPVGGGLTGLACTKSRERFQKAPKRPEGIVIHHSATQPENQALETAATINAMHRRRGFWKLYRGRIYHIGYHYVIRVNGTIERGRPELCPGRHTRSWQHNRWLGICVIGWFDPCWPNKVYHRPRPAQMANLIKLCNELMARYDIDLDHILPHREVNPTECPGRSFPMAECREGLKHCA